MHLRTSLAALSLFAVLPAQRILHTAYGTTPGVNFGCLIRAAGDANGDGLPDFLVGANGGGGSFQIISGADYSVLATFQPTAPNQFGFDERGCSVDYGDSVLLCHSRSSMGLPHSSSVRGTRQRSQIRVGHDLW